MSKDLVSKRTRRAFADYLTRFHVLREISGYFDDADIDQSDIEEEGSWGQRRSLTYSYYASTDWGDEADVLKVINAFEAILNDATAHSTEEFERLKKFLQLDGYEFINGQLIKVGMGVTQANKDALLGSKGIDPSQIMQGFHRIESSISKDPDAAIGNSKDLLETICKHILDSESIEYGKKEDLGSLVKKVLSKLRLTPDSINNSAKGAEIIKRLLSNLASITVSTAELRNLYGTGHGKNKSYKGLESRHARLTVNAAMALSVFIVETWDKRQESELT